MLNELEQLRGNGHGHNGNGILIPRRPENGHLIVRPDQYQAQVVEAMTRYVNKHGLNYEITFNTQSFQDVEEDTPAGKVKRKEWAYGGDWGFYESELHELVHCWQQTVVTDEKPDHNKTFHDKMMDFGIPTAPNGSHLDLAEEGKPFAILMKEWMVARPDLKDMPQGADLSWLIWWFEQMFGKEKRKGKSTLILYECPSCGLKLRVGRAKEELEIGCIKCSREKNVSTQDIVLFERHD